MPYSTINSEITNQRICLILIVILFGGAALIAGYKFFNSITSRLYKVIEGMRHVHADNLDNFIENDSDDELGELINNYNYMIAKMAVLVDEQYKLGKAVKNAELKALQSQINPHFLYNTLDMINWMAYKKRTSEISTAVKSLAKFYKLSLYVYLNRMTFVCRKHFNSMLWNTHAVSCNIFHFYIITECSFDLRIPRFELIRIVN